MPLSTTTRSPAPTGSRRPSSSPEPSLHPTASQKPSCAPSTDRPILRKLLINSSHMACPLSIRNFPFLLLATILVLPPGLASFPNSQECMSPLARSFQHCNATLSQPERVAALVGAMTLAEKVWSLSPDPSKNSDCLVNTQPVPRLGLGGYMWLTETNSQASSGCFQGKRCATAFPGALGLASSFNRSVWYAKGDVISTEMRANYNSGGWRPFNGHSLMGLTGFGPNINIARDPRFGRTSELPGEDPFLNGEYATHYVRGMQQKDSAGYFKMLAFLKHFTAYSKEVGRGFDNYEISPHSFFDTYLPAYEAGIRKGGAAGVMCSYNAANGQPSCANSFLLNDVMRVKWQCPDAIVMTDCGAVSNMLHPPVKALSPEHAAAWIIANGTDVEAGSHIFVDAMEVAVEKGLVDEAVINEAVRRVYAGMMKVGRFDGPDDVSWTSITSKAIGSDENKKVRDDAARQASVLLRNEGNVIPLKSGQTVVIVGPQGDNGYGMLPDYFGDQVCPPPDQYGCIPTFLDGLREYNDNGKVLFYKGVQDETSTKRTEEYEKAIDAVWNDADVVVLAMGISKKTEHETVDRTETALPGLQNQFAIDVLAAAAKKDIAAILILTNGGALSIDDLLPGRDYSTSYNADASSGLHGQRVDMPTCYRSRSLDSTGNHRGSAAKLPSKFAVIEAYNPSLGAKPIVAAMYGVGPIQWGRLVTTMYPKQWAETHHMDQYDLSAGDGLTYRYHAGNVLGTFGEGMPTEDPHTVVLVCSLQRVSRHAKPSWKVICNATNKGERALSVLVMAFVRASDEVKAKVGQKFPIPLRALRAFDRIMVGPGATERIDLALNIMDLMLVNERGHKEASPGVHFDYIDVWDGWDAFASYKVTLEGDHKGVVLKSY